jgi:excisionase family DNA binding protein
MTTTNTTTTEKRGTQRKVLGAVKGKRIGRDKSYTVAEVAELVGTTTAAVQRWVRLGYVPATKEPTGAYRIDGGDLADFLKARKSA